MVFVRIGYVYPSRTPVLRGLTTALGAVWAVMMLAIVLAAAGRAGLLLHRSLFFPVYYTVLSFWLHAPRGAGVMKLPAWSRRVRDRVFGSIFVVLVVR